MYASKTAAYSHNNNYDSQPKIPVETYDNRAVLQELARRSNNEQVQNTEQYKNECTKIDECEREYTNEDSVNTGGCKECKRNTHNTSTNKLFGKFEIDDAIIILIMILLLTDGNDNNDFMLPILLGILLLT